MAGLNDKKSGVFVIECTTTNRVYIGKSTGVGVAARSAKSKLSHGKFHNKLTQLDYNKYPSSFEFWEPDLLDAEENIDVDSLTKLLDKIQKLELSDGKLIYNDIEIIEFKANAEVNEIDLYGIDNLGRTEKDIIERILALFEREDYSTENGMMLSQHLAQVKI